MRKIVSSDALKSLGRRAVPFAGSVGVISDVATPLASFTDYLTILAGLVAVILGVYWFFFFNKDQDWSLDKGFMPRALIYAGLCTMVFGFFSLGQTLSGNDDRGFVATVIPGITKIQESVFRLEKTTQEMSQKLDRIEDQIDKKYTVKELKILADQEMWDEAMAHLEDIPPLQRDQPWRDVLEQIIVGWLYDMEIHEDIDYAYQQVRDTFQRFKVLKKSPQAMSYRKKIGLRYLKKCLQQNKPLKDCHPASMAFIRYDRNSVADLGFEVGKLTTYYRIHRGAIEYFHLALNEENKDQFCQEERLQLAITNGFYGFEGSQNMQQSQDLASLCFPYIKDHLAETLNAERSLSSSAERICQLFVDNDQPLEHCSALASANQEKAEKQKAKRAAHQNKKTK